MEEKQEPNFINNSQVKIEEEENNIDNESSSAPKLKFNIIKLDNKNVEIERNEYMPFITVLENLRKKDKELENLIFELIFYYDRCQKNIYKEKI